MPDDLDRPPPEAGSPQDERRGWREVGRDALVYFGLVDEQPSETPSGPWWLTALFTVPPLVAAWLLLAPLGLDDSFYTWAAVSFGCLTIWGTVVDAGSRRWLPSYDRSDGPAWKRPSTYISVGYSTLLTWLLYKSPHDQSSVFTLCTLGPTSFRSR